MMFPDDADVAGPALHFENHYSKEFVSGKRESLKTKSSDDSGRPS